MTCACPKCRPNAPPASPTGIRTALFSAEELALFPPEGRERLTRMDAERHRGTAFHEAGHVIGGLAVGYAVGHATTETGYPHAQMRFRPEAETPSPAGTLLMLLAGPMGEAVGLRRFLRPTANELTALLRVAGEQDNGRCDDCQVARILLAMPDLADDDARAAVWLAAWDAAYALFDQLPVRLALARVAAALERDVLLTGAQVEALVDVGSLREAVEDAIAAAVEPELLLRTEGTST